MNDKPDQSAHDSKVDKPLIAIAGDVRSELNTLKEICLSLGLEPTQAMGVLKFEGKVNGRQVTIVAGIRSRNRYVGGDISYRTYQGISLDIAVGSAAKTRLHLMPPHLAWLNRFTMPRKGNKRLKNLKSMFDQFHVWAHDPEWATSYLSHPKVQAIIKSYYFSADGKPIETSPFSQKLLNAAIPSLVKVKRQTTYFLNISPEGFNLSIGNPPAPFTKEQFHGWLDQLFELAALAENPLPQEAKLTSFEQMPSQTRALILACTYLFGGTFLLGACCAGPLFICLATLTIFSS
ncbi:MAG: hypothetical protein AAGD96_02595 [Chloroflexota bacterium]